MAYPFCRRTISDTVNARMVLISDVHFGIQTLALAYSALSAAIDKAEELGVPLVIAGDLLDTKAILRAEVVNTLISLFREIPKAMQVYVIPGNHCMINAHGSENSLKFLSPYVHLIDVPSFIKDLGTYLVPYQSDPSELERFLGMVPEGSTLIMHQGVQGADMGHYVRDKTSLPKEVFSDFRVISGHYHRAQDIKCGRPRKGAVGLFSYIGNPYTLGFGEAGDGPKGYAILLNNGLLERVPLSLRKHVILEVRLGDLIPLNQTTPGDLIWLKLHGTRSELLTVDKRLMGQKFFEGADYRLDLIPDEEKLQDLKVENLSDLEILDSLIDGLADTEEHKNQLKMLWREIIQ